MKKEVKKEVCLILVSVIILVFLISNISAATSECKKTCVSNKTFDKDSCNNNFNLCKEKCINYRKCVTNCTIDKISCFKQVDKSYLQCGKNCDSIGKGISQSVCKSGNGLYQRLCNGPYFDMFCTTSYFCICSGDSNYSCPTDFTCSKDSVLSITTRKNTLLGWKTPLGKALGDIGICIKRT